MEPLTDGDPRRAGPYRIQARLGSGGMGQVYLALSPAGRAVAVKVVRAELSHDPMFLSRFRSEVTAAQRVSGVYTAPVVDASAEGEIPPWLATAFVPGPSLADVITEFGPLPEQSVWRLAAGLAEALTVIHQHGIIHRDLKPANVLLASDGPRVIDFGISRALDMSGATTTGVVVGTASFMSPEQAEGLPVGPATDVFALGCVLAYAATGVGSFGTGTPASIIYRIVHAEPQLDHIPEPLQGFIARCLIKDPSRRPTLPELMTAITAYQPAPGLVFWPPDLAVAIAAYQDRLTELPHEPTRPAVIQAPPGLQQTVTGFRRGAAMDGASPPPSSVRSTHHRQASDRPGRTPRKLVIGGVLAAFLAIACTAIVLHARLHPRPDPTPSRSLVIPGITLPPGAKIKISSASPAPARAGEHFSHLLIAFSGNGEGNSTTFRAPSEMFARYSFRCWGGDQGMNAQIVSATDSGPIAEPVTVSGSGTDFVYPDLPGTFYHIAVVSPTQFSGGNSGNCSWHVRLYKD